MRVKSANVKTVDTQKEIPGDSTLYIRRRLHSIYEAGTQSHASQHRTEPSSEHEPTHLRAPAPSINDSVRHPNGSAQPWAIQMKARVV
jgi:hypothetical protein